MEAALEADREAHRLIDARAAEALQDQINMADDMVKSLRKAVHTACNKDYNQWWDDQHECHDEEASHRSSLETTSSAHRRPSC